MERWSHGPHISVTPRGDFNSHYTQTYGSVGNRWVLYDDQPRIITVSASKAWRGGVPYGNANNANEPRPQPVRYTLLRFLDAATALVVGHVPGIHPSAAR